MEREIIEKRLENKREIPSEYNRIVHRLLHIQVVDEPIVHLSRLVLSIDVLVQLHLSVDHIIVDLIHVIVVGSIVSVGMHHRRREDGVESLLGAQRGVTATNRRGGLHRVVCIEIMIHSKRSRGVSSLIRRKVGMIFIQFIGFVVISSDVQIGMRGSSDGGIGVIPVLHRIMRTIHRGTSRKRSVLLSLIFSSMVVT